MGWQLFRYFFFHHKWVAFYTVFLVNDKKAGTDRNGKAVLSLELSDSSGILNARMFERVESFVGGFEVGDVVWVKGFVQLFQNRRQLIVHEVRRAAERQYRSFGSRTGR